MHTAGEEVKEGLSEEDGQEGKRKRKKNGEGNKAKRKRELDAKHSND